MTLKENRRRRAAICSAVAAMGFAGVCAGATATVSVNSGSIGVTPRYMGYNMGHYMPGSNTSAWLQYSGVNAFRFWASPGDYEPTDDRAPFGDGVTTLSQFDSRKDLLRADLRANPTSTTYVNWSYFNPRFDATQSGRNKATLNYNLSEVQKLGMDVVMQITRSNASQYQIADWGGKWEQWQHYYAMAFNAAREYDVQRYQMYNEPDLDDIPRAEWVQRLQLASDAVKAAIEDVNTITGKKLSWGMYAPVAASTLGSLHTWGKDALNANRTDYAGRATTYDIFDTYDVHRYNSQGATFASDQATFAGSIPGYNPSGQMLPIAYTEFNRYNSGTYSNRTDGPDTPQNAAEFGGIFPGAMTQSVQGQDVKAMYAFKFSQTMWTSSTTGKDEKQKTGFHYVENSGPYDITGSTRAAETMRLAAKALKGERAQLGQTVSASDTTYDAAGTFDPGRENYYFYSVNRHTTEGRTVTLNLGDWNVPGGTIISVQEVSGGSFGAGKPSQFLTVPSSGAKTVTFTQPKTSVWLLTAPSMAQTVVNLSPTADAQVSKATPIINFGLLTTAKVNRSATTTADDAAYLKFSIAGQDKAKVGRAFLNVTGVNSADAEPVHVYGFIKSSLDSWTETGINWNNAPGLGSGAADAKLMGVGPDALPVGQLTWNSSLEEWGIDVTEFVRKHPDSDLSFVLIRENRFDPDPVPAGGTQPLRPGDTDTTRVTINTREAIDAGTRPRVSLYLTPNPVYYWNINAPPNPLNPLVAPTFGAPGSWDAGAPNGAGAIAVLGDFITSPRTVSMNAAATVGELRLDSHLGYTLSGSAALELNGGTAPSSINVYKGSHQIDTPVTLATATGVFVEPELSLTISKPLAGSGALTKTGSGTLVLGAASPSFSGGLTVNGGMVRLTASDVNAVSGAGTGAIVVNSGAALQLENVSLGASGKPGPDLTLNGGSTLTASGASVFSKSNSPMIVNGPSSTATAVNITTLNASSTLSFLSAFRNVSSAASSTTVNINGPGRVVLQSGGLSSSGAFAGSWNVAGGTLQLGPSSGTSEALNAPGFKNGDAKQGNLITVNSSGLLLGAVNAPQSANAGTTPSFFRAGVRLNGGSVGSTGLNANFGGDFTTQATSSVLVYDALATGTARSVNLVGAAAGTLNNAAATNWSGTLTIDPGATASGGAFNVNRTGGTIAVTPGASIVVKPRAVLNVGGAADALSDGVDHVNITNDATGGFNVTAGVKNVGTVGGSGASSVASGATLIAGRVRQSALVVQGSARIRPSGANSSVSNIANLDVRSTGQLNLTNNYLVTSTALGTWSTNAYTGVQGLVAKGYNEGAWDGLGLITEGADARSGLTTLGTANAGEVLYLLPGETAMWAGQLVSSASTLVAYTYSGDANLDGHVDADDYSIIDTNYRGGGQTGYSRGDFNYDGRIDADDYSHIDVAYRSQRGSFALTPAEGVSLVAVPEPGAMGLAIGLSLGCALRRRRRR